MTKTKVKTKTKNLASLDQRFWDDFVLVVYASLDNFEERSAKDIEKYLVEKKWGHPRVNLINKALNHDLKEKVRKSGRKYLRII